MPTVLLPSIFNRALIGTAALIYINAESLRQHIGGYGTALNVDFRIGRIAGRGTAVCINAVGFGLVVVVRNINRDFLGS